MLPLIGVQNHQGQCVHPFIINGTEYRLRLGQDRLVLFKQQPFCKECGEPGSYFQLEDHYHPNNPLHRYSLYPYTQKGFKLTKDHIYPRCKGGINGMINYQTLCARCNGRKSNQVKLTDVEIEGLYMPIPKNKVYDPRKQRFVTHKPKPRN